MGLNVLAKIRSRFKKLPKESRRLMPKNLVCMQIGRACEKYNRGVLKQGRKNTRDAAKK